MSHPESIFPILEMAEAGKPVAEVPANKENELTYCTARGLVNVSESHQIGWTRCKTVRKPATELRPGDVIQFEPDDKNGYRVESVTLVPDAERPHTVKMWGSGPPGTYSYKAQVTVFDGALPEPVYSKPGLRLTAEGRAVLALHRIASLERGKRFSEVSVHANETRARGKVRRPRGRPRGSDSAAYDRKLFEDWTEAKATTGMTKPEFLRARGLPEKELAAIERGRAQAKRRPGQK
jgi:hypothetical protein